MIYKTLHTQNVTIELKTKNQGRTQVLWKG